MKISLKNGKIERCEECGLNHYIKICIKCKGIFATRNANEVRYCSKRCSKLGVPLSMEHKLKISKTLTKSDKKIPVFPLRYYEKK